MIRTLPTIAIAAGLVFGQVSTLHADEPPGAAEILRSMKSAVEPPRASLRHVEMTLTSGGASRSWTARQARSPKADGTQRLVMVLLSPIELRGTAIMIEERKNASNLEWMWMPAVGRVRKVVPSLGFESFLGTDFTYADIGFVPIEGQRLGPVKEETIDGTASYVVEELIEDRPWFYSRIETTVARDTLLPVQRVFYDVAGAAWKKEVFEKAEEVEGIPTPLVVRMEDLQAGSSTELRYDHVDYRDTLPEELFDPVALPRLLGHSIWEYEAP